MPLCRILSRQGIEIRRFATESPAVGTSFSVGRSSSCTIVLKHDAGRTVSRIHFTMEQRPTGWFLVNKSSHGTYKGDRSIEQTEVNPGDVFQFGSCFFCFGEEAGPTPYQLHWETEAGGEDYAVLWPGRNTVGAASSNTVSIKQDSVSRQHARITVNADVVYLEDLNSSLGTFVGGKRVSALTEVAEGAQLRFGKARAWLVQGTVVPTTGSLTVDTPIERGGIPLWLKVVAGCVVALILLAILLKLFL